MIATQLGVTIPMAGIIFSDADNVILDLVWISHNRLALGEDEAGHLTVAPELIVEVLSFGKENEKRDRETKLYSTRGVQEYWILDWQLQQVEIYRREQAVLSLFATLNASDTLTSPLTEIHLSRLSLLPPDKSRLIRGSNLLHNSQFVIRSDSPSESFKINI